MSADKGNMTKTLTKSLIILLLTAACGDPVCLTCRSDKNCGPGETCLPEGTCGRTCSLTVLHDGPNNDAPCAAGVGTCPETCQDASGVFGHCTAHPGLPEDVGLCLAPTGAPVCP